jgi:hypothetical protein
MPGFEGTEREDHDEREAGVGKYGGTRWTREVDYRLRPAGFG